MRRASLKIAPNAVSNQCYEHERFQLKFAFFIEFQCVRPAARGTRVGLGRFVMRKFHFIADVSSNLCVQAAIDLYMFYRAGFNDFFIPFGKVGFFPIIAKM